MSMLTLLLVSNDNSFRMQSVSLFKYVLKEAELDLSTAGVANVTIFFHWWLAFHTVHWNTLLAGD